MAQTQKESKVEHKAAVEKVDKAESVQKPNREAVEKEVEALRAKMKENQAIIDEVKTTLDKLKDEKEKKAAEKKETPEETKLNELRVVSKGLKETRDSLLEQLKKAKDTRQQLHDQYESMRKRIRDLSVSSLDDLEKKIRSLEFTMSTTTMSLREERSMMQDIKNLSANKKVFGEVDAAKQARDAAEAKSKEIKEKLDENKAAYEKAKAAEDAAYKVVSKQRDSRKGKRIDFPAMMEKRNKARDENKAMFAKINALRDDLRAREDAWRKIENERWRERKEKQKAEYEARREENRLRDLEKEEAKFETLHADKLASIEQLIVYLRLKQGTTNGSAPAEEPAATPAPQEEEENLIGKNVKHLEDDLFGTKVQKKGKKKGGKKKQQPTNMSHDINSLQEFSTLKVSAPVSLGEIPACIEQLEKKRDELKKDKEAQWEKYQAKKEKALAEHAAKADDKDAKEDTKEDAKDGEKDAKDSKDEKPADAKEAEPAAVTAAE